MARNVRICETIMMLSMSFCIARDSYGSYL